MESQHEERRLTESLNSENTILEAFLTAAPLVLSEVAGTSIELSHLTVESVPVTGAGITATLTLQATTQVCLAFCSSQETARHLARRMLAEVPGEVDDAMVRDCAGELVNVIAGQAKAILTGTSQHFTFNTPTVYAESGHELTPPGSGSCHVATFASDVGDVEIRLYSDHVPS